MSRSEVIKVASDEEGNGEFPINSNKTKYGKWYGNDGQYWCGMFVSWVFYQAGVPLPFIDSSRGFCICENAVDYFANRGLLTQPPQPGDIVFYDFQPWSGRKADHTGIFVRWLDTERTRFEAWEGNTDPNHDRNGGTVMLRSRTKKDSTKFANPGVFQL